MRIRMRNRIMRSGFAFVATLLLLTAFNNCGKYQFSSVSSNNASTPVTPAGSLDPLAPPSNETPTPFTNTTCMIGYPFSSANPATSVQFNESDILAAFNPQSSTSLSANQYIDIWYSDEHAMTLGIRQINVVTANGTATTNYPISTMAADPDGVANPQVGATNMTGNQAGVDTSACAGTTADCSRPMWPAMFVTDTSSNPTATTGDWQNGGIAYPPSAIFGTWKAAVRTIDETITPPKVTLKTDGDPMPNGWNLGNAIPAPSNMTTEGYTALVRWQVSNLGLQSGHSYRLQFMVHDGDQNRSGGDVGENCIDVVVP